MKRLFNSHVIHPQINREFPNEEVRQLTNHSTVTTFEFPKSKKDLSDEQRKGEGDIAGVLAPSVERAAGRHERN